MKLQQRMYKYHAELKATHPYSSPWYLWPLDIKPVWYYKGIVPKGVTATIVAIGNPIIWWSGIAAFIWLIKEAVLHRKQQDILDNWTLESVLDGLKERVAAKKWEQFPLKKLVSVNVRGFLGVDNNNEKEAVDKNLSAHVFDSPLRKDILARVVKYQRNAMRQGTACAKNRA